MIDEKKLRSLYYGRSKSMQDIAELLDCSVHKVTYWMDKHGIERRSWSEATYVKHNPKGDPFKFKPPVTVKDHELYGLGLGLYWGEGTKSNNHSIRLGNTDPALLRAFIRFLIRIIGVKKKDLKFGLQIFSDINPNEALDFWTKSLKVDRTQFWKPTVTIQGKVGNYKNKSKYGVVTVHYSNKKARDLLGQLMPA